MKFWQKLVGIIIAPKKTFLYLKDKPDWKVPAFANLATIGLLFLLLQYILIRGMLGGSIETLTEFIFVSFVCAHAGVGIFLVACIFWGGILSGALYLSGRMLKVSFNKGQLYTISGYSFFVPVLLSVAMFRLYWLVNPFPITLLSPAELFYSAFSSALWKYTGVFFLIWSIFLLGVGVWCVIGKLRKTLLIVSTLCVLVLLSLSGVKFILSNINTSSAEFKFNNHARKVENVKGHSFYEWVVFMDEPVEKLAQVERVRYKLHRSFPERVQIVKDREDRFALKRTGWGTFWIYITVYLKDGKKVNTKYYLSFDKSWP